MNIYLNELPESILEDLFDDGQLLYVTSVIAEAGDPRLIVSAPGYEYVNKNEYMRSINVMHPINSFRRIKALWNRDVRKIENQCSRADTILLYAAEILELLETGNAPAIILVD